MPRRLASLAELGPAVRSRRALVDEGWTDRGIRDAVRARRLRLVRRGWFIESDEYDALWPEAQHLAHVLAVMRDSSGSGVVSHESAAVVWGLPLYRLRPARVHLTTTPGARISSGADVFRHVAPLPAEDVVLREGLLVTSLARTVFDVARTLPVEPALVIADAAERAMAARGREWDLDAVESWRRAWETRTDAATGARGIRHARRIGDFADGRSESPGESVSRLQIARLGFRRPALQVPVPGPDGRDFFLDFRFTECGAFGEFDGKGKYVDEALRRGLSMEAILLREKMREDWVRGTTQSGFARWGDEHIGTARALGMRLDAFGIRPLG